MLEEAAKLVAVVPILVLETMRRLAVAISEAIGAELLSFSLVVVLQFCVSRKARSFC